MKGTVKFFSSEKEFGFLTGEDGKEYFVHKSDLEDGVVLSKDDSVTFETEQGDKGLKAVKVSK